MSKMIQLPEHLKKDPVVCACVTVADYIGRFEVASGLEGLASGNPNIGKPRAGRFDFKNVAVEAAMRDEEFTRAVEVLIENNSNPDIKRILQRLYHEAPQLQETYKQ